jgi:hypothetical protein
MWLTRPKWRDNPVLVQLPNGNVLLSDRSVITNVSTKIEVWTATNVLLSNPFTLKPQLVDDIENPNQTTRPFNKSPMVLCGVGVREFNAATGFQNFSCYLISGTAV